MAAEVAVGVTLGAVGHGGDDGAGGEQCEPEGGDDTPDDDGDDTTSSHISTSMSCGRHDADQVRPQWRYRLM